MTEAVRVTFAGRGFAAAPFFGRPDFGFGVPPEFSNVRRKLILGCPIACRAATLSLGDALGSRAISLNRFSGVEIRILDLSGIKLDYRSIST
jgi:hypothetical protein